MKTVIAILAAAMREPRGGRELFDQPPEYVHVLLNPLPVYGLALGFLALAAALLARSKAAQVIALALVVLTSASAWPVLNSGDNAYQQIREKSDDDGQRWLDEHMDRAERFVYAFYATALLGIAALISQKKFPRVALPLTVATLIAGGVSLGVGAWIAKAGGQVRHPEFRARLPSTNAGPPQPVNQTNKAEP
jgi:hypothetical protein